MTYFLENPVNALRLIFFLFTSVNNLHTFLYAQSPRYRFDHVTEIGGKGTLGTINYIYQDSKGFMWFGGSRGLQRFDGYQLMYFNDFPLEPGNITRMLINTVLEDNRGNLWVGTNYQGLLIFDRITEKFISFYGDNNPAKIPKLGIVSILQDQEGILWFGTIQGGLYRYNDGTGTFTNFLADTSLITDARNTLWSLVEDRHGTIWAGTANGLFTFDKASGLFTPVEPVPPPPEGYRIYKALMTDSDGNVWIGSDWGMYRVDSRTGEWKHFFPEFPVSPFSPSSQYIMDIREYQSVNKHELWIATTWGLNKYDITTGRFIHLFHDSEDLASLRDNLSSGLFIDAQGYLWTASGAASKTDLNQAPFEHIPLKTWPDGLHDLAASCFYEDRKGHLWVGTYDNGIYEFGPAMDFIGNYKPTPRDRDNADNAYHNRIEAICETSSGHLLVSTFRFAVFIFDRQKKSFEPIPFFFPEGIPEPHDVAEILEDHTGTLWYGANDGLFMGGLSSIRSRPVTVVADSVLTRAKILDMLEDSRKALWIVTMYDGVYSLPAENRKEMDWIRFTRDDYDHRGMKAGTPRFVCEDNTGRVWLMALSGLYSYDRETKVITRHEHFSRIFPAQVYQITSDAEGYLWLKCDEGLIRYDPNDTTVRTPKVYNAKDGMPFDALSHIPFMVDSKGYIYASSGLGSGRGFFRFNPKGLTGDNLHVPLVVLTDFKVKNRDLPLDTSITEVRSIKLRHNENFFSFEFSALDYAEPDKNQYAYTLEGYDEEWIYPINRRFANYTGVPPGTYVFRVRGSNNDGYWNEEGARVDITILKPPWKAWWAIVLYGLFIAAVFISIAWYYLKRQQLRHALAIEQIQKEKLAELDRMKSRFFANISHEFRTPLTLILGPIDKLRAVTQDPVCQEDLNVMQRNAHRLQRLIDQLLNLSKLEAGQMKLHAENENISSLVKSFVQQFESLAKQKKIELLFHAEKDVIPAFVDKEKLEIILYNLLSNAFKWTREGGQIRLAVGSWQSAKNDENIANCQLPIANLHKQCVVISISDTGVGIPPEQLPRIFDRFYQADDSITRNVEGSGIGLALTKELVELHGGTITVESVVKQGSMFRVFLPLGDEQLKSKSREQRSKIKDDFDIDNRQPTIDNQEPATRNPERETRNAEPLLLIVEDNADLRLYIRGILESDYRVQEAGTGRQGLESALEHIPDLILSDVMMPEMDGYELSRKLKSDERTSHIPVILLTAKAAMEDRLEGLETGADDFIIKPFHPKELLVRINNLIRQRQQLREKFRKDFEHVRMIPEHNMSPIESMFMEKARKVVGEHLTDADFDIGSFSRQMNMSRVQLHRKLGALFNMSASEFIRTYRLNKAARLFESKAGNVAEVAYEVGFNNLSYFARCFQKQFGMNPSEYLHKS